MSRSLTSNASNAAFSFIEYEFVRSSVDFSSFKKDDGLEIDFNPKGVYDEDTGRFRLNLRFRVFAGYYKRRDVSDIKNIVSVDCVAMFKFREALALEELPNYFFANSIAILYPYIRAFVSTLTLQSNHAPVMLPTFNVSPLGEELKANTVVGSLS